MKHINNKGFTLVEVLAVLVILTIIISIAIPSISSSIGRSKSTQNAIRYNFLENKAEEYVGDNKSEVINSLTGGVNECYIEISTLISKGYVSEKEAKDSDGNSLDKYIIYNYEDNTYKYSTLINGLSKCGASPVSNNDSSDESEDPCIENISIKLGDYIKMTPTLTSYSVDESADGTGNAICNQVCSSNYKETQEKLNPSLLSLWRIINLDGALEAVSEYTSEKPIYFYKEYGYKNYVKVLHDVALAYGNDNYVSNVRAIDGNNGASSVIDKEISYFTVSNFGDCSTGSDCWNDDRLNLEKSGFGDHAYNNNNLPNDLILIKNVYNELNAYTVNPTNPTKPTSVGGEYLVSSRKYYYNSSIAYSYWKMSAVRKQGFLDFRYFFWKDSRGVTYTSGPGSSNGYMRPIITLKSLDNDICVNGGEGTKGEPYKLKVITKKS